MKIFFKNFIAVSFISTALIFLLFILGLPLPSISILFYIYFFALTIYLFPVLINKLKQLFLLFKNEKNIILMLLIGSAVMHITLPLLWSYFVYAAKLHVYEAFKVISLVSTGFLSLLLLITNFSSIKKFFLKKDEYLHTFLFNNKNVNNKSLILVILLIIIGALLRFNNLSKINLHQDEVYFTIAAKNYELFEKFQINWRENWIPDDKDLIQYDRAKPLIFFLSKLWSHSDYSESNLRTPFVFIGIVMLPLIYLIIRKITSNLVALLTLIFSTFDSHLIFYSRSVREYIVLAFFTLILAFIVDNIVKKLPKLSIFPILIFIIVSITFAFVSFQVLLVMLAFAVFGGYIFLVQINKEKSLFTLQRPSKKVLILFLSLITTFSCIIFFYSKDIANVLLNDITKNVILMEPNTEYFSALTDTYKFSFLAWIFSAIALSYFIINPKKTFLLFLVAVPFVLLTFVFKHATAIRYILIIRVFMHTIVSLGVISFCYLLFSKSKKPNLKIEVVSIFITLLLTKMSFVGVPKISFLTEKAQSQWDYGDSLPIDISTMAPNFRDAFNYVKENYRDGDKIITRDYTSYYYLSPLFHNSYHEVYFVNRTGGSLTNLNTGLAVKTKKILNDGSRKWIIVGRTTYFSKELLSYMRDEMDLISGKIESIPKINYLNKETLYWPQVFLSKEHSL